MSQNFYVTEPKPEGIDDYTAMALAYESRRRAFCDFNLSGEEMARLTLEAQREVFLKIQKELIEERFKREQNRQFYNLCRWEPARIEELVKELTALEFETDF